MKKFIALLVIILAVFVGFVLVNTFGTKIDYDNPLQASNAYESGEDITGKIISVKCNLIFTPAEYMGKYEMYTDMNTMQLYYVKVYVNSNRLKNGDTVKVRVSAVNKIDSRYLYIMGDIVD